MIDCIVWSVDLHILIELLVSRSIGEVLIFRIIGCSATIRIWLSRLLLFRFEVLRLLFFGEIDHFILFVELRFVLRHGRKSVLVLQLSFVHVGTQLHVSLLFGTDVLHCRRILHFVCSVVVFGCIFQRRVIVSV